MPGTKRSIGGRGLEQGGPNLGNDISRNISREVQADDSTAPVVKNKNKNKQRPVAKKQSMRTNSQRKNKTGK